MADFAGLVVGIVALWKSCIQVYETVDSTRQHGMEFELLNVKFEVERVRLLCWGDAVGLADVHSLNIRLRREEVRSTVIRLLGCIQHVFENTDRLQDRYGLQAADPISQMVTSQGQSHGQEPPPSQSQHILNGVFRRTYDNLRRRAGERQRTTPLTRRMVWVVRDRRKFETLINELRGFNNSLESLFPDAQMRAAEVMRADIQGAVEVHELQLLQEATAEVHRDLSECASLRLETLGASISARTDLLSVSGTQDEAASQATVKKAGANDDWEDSDKDIPPGDRQGEGEVDEVTKRLREVELYVEKKNFGALTLSLRGPYGSGLEHVSGHVYWDGHKTDSEFPFDWNDRGRGFVPITHAAFDMYKKKRYMKKPYRDKHVSPDSEDYTLFDPESFAKFENENPGTITVEGYGLECWAFEQTKPSNRPNPVFANYSELPALRAKTLLRRIDELQKHTGKFGWSPIKEELDLKEMVGTLGIVYYDQKYAKDPNRWIGDLYSLLNRTDVFVDFTTTSTIGMYWAGIVDNGVNLWNFLHQVIVSRELAMRLNHPDGSKSHSGFTERILGSLIVSELWLKHVRIVLTDEKLPVGGVKGAETAEQMGKAEDYKNQGNEALKKNEYQKAVELYTEAIKLDLSNAIYRCNRSAAMIGLEMYEEAEGDAHIATLLDSKYAKAWSRLGMAMFKRGDAKRAKKAYERAIQVAGKDATVQMRHGLASAKEKIKEKVKAINSEKDVAKLHSLSSAYSDEDWEISGKTLSFNSLIHEQQVEGLLLFAERMRWPYINEVRDYAEDVYSSVLAGGSIDVDLYDWLYGIVLPGKLFAVKIMRALILCTPSMKDKAGIAPYWDCGLVLPTRSYWRLRTVMGRVLGCLPGIISLCGWIGPCPKVEFDPPVEGQIQPRHVRVKARQIALTEHNLNSNDGVRRTKSYDRRKGTPIRPDEEIEPYLAEVCNPSNWVIPEPPVREVGTCEIVSIQLKKLALQVEMVQKATQGKIQDTEAEHKAEYRASITFKMDNNEEAITYKLFTNPVFVTPPSCDTGPKGQHEVHIRELPRYQKNIWSVERLKDHTAEDTDDDEVMVINATGNGAEVLARAWCSERGKCAVIRRPGGPCFVCAVRAASKPSLATSVLIWTGQEPSDFGRASKSGRDYAYG